MIAKAQADSVCAFFGNVEINFTLRSVFTNLPCGEFRMHLGKVEINFTLRSVFTNLPYGEFRMHLGNVEINFTLRSVFTKFVSYNLERYGIV